MRQIAAHLVTLHIRSRIQSRLKDIGYAKEASGGLVLTDDGLQRLRWEND
jgi:porphobilinogen deaminase